ncbi:hypothetical protein MKW98_021274 [Papaver atlanticum]|uniref:Uncharacterized protein n=1 Tax=Papaver atlanticum TaxID=357466 RepID=A0AAD4XJA7_9MAGN|nr:hypothetical protein MKW98_021274 [Papaver atlanticum]
MSTEGPKTRSKGKRKTVELRTNNRRDVNVNVDITNQRVEIMSVKRSRADPRMYVLYIMDWVMKASYEFPRRDTAME